MSTDVHFEQLNPGETNPAEVFVVMNQRPMWLPLVAVQSYARFIVEVTKQAGTAAIPQAGEQTVFAKHASLRGVTMGA